MGYFESVVVKWMNLGPVIHNDVRKRKTSIRDIYIYMESRKMVPMNLFAGQE